MVSPGGQLNVESRLMHSHNELFQEQLKAMHWLVEEQKKSPPGYQFLERALAGGPYDDIEYTRRGKKRSAAAAAAAAAAANSSKVGIGGGSAGPGREAPSVTVTPDTGCPHGEVYCKNLCRSCYQRWRRATAKIGTVEYDPRALLQAQTAVEEDEDEEEESVASAGAGGTDGGTATPMDEDSVGGGGGGGRRGTSRSRRGPAPSMAELNAMMNATGRGRGAKRPPTQRKQPDLCVQCDLRPILCRSLCNGCYQKWHKQRKAAMEQGLPEVPCPSIAILAQRKAAAEAAAAAAAEAGEEGGSVAGAGGAEASQQQEQQQPPSAAAAEGSA